MQKGFRQQLKSMQKKKQSKEKSISPNPMQCKKPEALIKTELVKFVTEILCQP